MSFHPLIEDIVTISDDEINNRLTELRGRLLKAHALNMNPAVSQQLDSIINSLHYEQQRRALAKAMEQNTAE